MFFYLVFSLDAEICFYHDGKGVPNPIGKFFYLLSYTQVSEIAA